MYAPVSQVGRLAGRKSRNWVERQIEATEASSRHRKPIVGLAGGVGSGKSTVAGILGELGAGVISSDAISHEELDTASVKAQVRSWWGDTVICGDGHVDREKVAGIVFSDPVQRHRLEAVIHPRIAIRRADKIREFEDQGRIKMIVLDSPLLYEADLDLLCDAVIFVDSTFENRLARSQKTRGWTEEELRRREKCHLPLDMKLARADYVCRNNSTAAELRAQVERIFSQIVSQDSTP